jgi:glycine cleavage system H lipoate-binding protein
MKHISSHGIRLSLLCTMVLITVSASAIADNPAIDTIKIVTDPALTALVRNWVSDYSRTNADAVFSVINRGIKPLGTGSQVCFVPGESSEAGDNSWKIVVAHDAIVPVFNSKNPCLKLIMASGISGDGFGKILQGSGKILWSEIIPGCPEKPVILYLPDNSSLCNSVAGFSRTVFSGQLAVKIVNSENLIEGLRKDIYAIGFCRMNDIILPGTPVLPADIALLPVDRNGNGRIDSFERIYDNPETLLRGVWTGKYPHSLSGSIYAVSALKPENKNTLAFLRWVISGGDKFISSAGFSNLSGNEKETGLTALADVKITAVVAAGQPVSYSWLIILVIIIISAGIVTALLETRRKKAPVTSRVNEREIPLLNENIITAPGGLYFDKSHSWAFMERDGLVRTGVDDFLQHVTGTITEIRLREPGEYIRRGEKFLTIIRDGKQLNLFAPVTGIIRSQNTDLYLDASIINSSPYSDGWVYLIEPKNWLKEIQMMFVTDRFREWTRDEISRLKDFVATTLKSHYPAYAQVVLQDGGELTDNLLEKLGPEVWEDFQIDFIDKSR